MTRGGRHGRAWTLVSVAGMTVPVLLALLLTGAHPVRLPAAPDAPPPAAPAPSRPSPPVTDFADYGWPTDGGRKLTSTFAEFRRTHFHGGIDIGTGSTTGFGVFSMRDGFVERIRVSPTGYGKMLYVRHPDGFITTYAHLERFADAIEARVLREQLALERYPVEIRCSPAEFPVRKGDRIAYTGETGVGTPHLHFELRDPDGEFVNPFLCPGITVTDNIRPIIRRIAVRPLSPDAAVNGADEPLVLRAVGGGRGDYRVDGTVRITGDVGFSIDARDLSDGSNFRHGLYSYVLELDGEPVQTVRLDRAPSEEGHLIRLYYDWELMGRGRFEKLYVDAPHGLPMYTPAEPGSGYISSRRVSEGSHTVRIIASDFTGNSSAVTIPVVSRRPPRFELVRGDRDFTLDFSAAPSPDRFLLYTRRNAAADWSLKTVVAELPSGRRSLSLPEPDGKYDILKVIAESEFGTRSAPRFVFFRKPEGPAAGARLSAVVDGNAIRLLATTSGTFTAAPSVVAYEGGVRRTLPLTPVDIDRYTGTLYPLDTVNGLRRLVLEAEVNGRRAQANEEFDLYPIPPGRSGVIRADGGRLSIAFDSASVYAPLLLRIERTGTDQSPAYRLHPEGAVIRRGLTVSIQAPPASGRRGLFADGMGREELLSARPDADGRYTGHLTRALGEVYVASDNTPPGISRLSVTRTAGGRPHIQFRYGDDRAGVDYQELKLYIDGTFVVPEIDGEHRRVHHRVANPLAPGSHHLVIRIADRLGNTGQVERRFTVR